MNGLEKELEDKLTLLVYILADIWKNVRENAESERIASLRLKYRDALVSFGQFASIRGDEQQTQAIITKVREKSGLTEDQAKRVFHKLELDLRSVYQQIEKNNGLPFVRETPGGKSKEREASVESIPKAAQEAVNEKHEAENETTNNTEPNKVSNKAESTANEIIMPSAIKEPNKMNSGDIMKILAENRHISSQANQRYAKTVLKNLIKVIRKRGPENIEKEILKKMNPSDLESLKKHH